MSPFPEKVHATLLWITFQIKILVTVKEKLGMSVSIPANTTKSIAASKSLPIVFWAWLGAIFLVLELYVWQSWLFGPNFVATDPGPDPIAKAQLWYIYGLQGLSLVLGVVAIWYWILKPWVREGHLTTNAMLAICTWMCLIWDCSMSYTVTTVLYNSHAFNRGAWTMGSWPGWTSPNGNLLPEPLLLMVPTYLWSVYFYVVFPCWVVNKFKARYPNLGLFSTILILALAVMITDTIVEILILRTGIYAYPAGIREFTLFAGKTYQFPLTEALTFGGALVAVAILRYFVDDKGQTFVEKGIEKLKVPQFGKQWVKFLALFGFVHVSFLLIFFVPNQWLGTHGDPYPEGYPSYMLNNMCKYGDNHDQCPGPGISIPRPLENPW